MRWWSATFSRNRFFKHIFSDRLSSFEQLNRAVYLIVETLCVRDVVFVRSVNFIIRDLLVTRISFLMLDIQQLSSHKWPRDEWPTFVQSCEEAIFLSPDQIVALVLHAHKVDQIKVWVRYDSNRRVVLHERESVAKLAVLQQTANATDGWR